MKHAVLVKGGLKETKPGGAMGRYAVPAAVSTEQCYSTLLFAYPQM
jgi:hypothetical protein